MGIEKSQIRVSLVIFDLYCDPDRVSEILSLTPSSVERKGDLTRTGKPKFESSNAWVLKSDLEDEPELDIHVKCLFTKVGDFKRISKVSSTWGMRIDCCLQFAGSDNTPTLYLSEESVDLMSKCRCSMDIDYYF